MSFAEKGLRQGAMLGVPERLVIAGASELLIPRRRSVVVACDVDSLTKLERLVSAVSQEEAIGGYKVGFELSLRYGLSAVTHSIREIAGSEACIIYDHQKAGTDTPHTGLGFVSACRDGSANSAIIFPFTGIQTLESWIEAFQQVGLTPIVGGKMTHRGFLVSDGGFIADDAPEGIYRRAAKLGVRSFVVPGTDPVSSARYAQIIEDILGEGNFELMSPGFSLEGRGQGGNIKDFMEEVGDNRRVHAIVGRAIFNNPDPANAVKEFAVAMR